MNEIYQIEITSLDHQGRGIGRINNQIIFVPDSLIGELVDVKITLQKKKYLEGQVINYVKKSKERINPICPYYSICGGCDLMHMSYDKQLEYKENKIKNIMMKYASLDCVKNIIGSSNDLYYRNKVTFQVKENIGLFKKKTYDIIAVDKCLLAAPLIDKYYQILKNMNLEGIKQVIIRSSNEALIIFVCDEFINIDTSLFDCNVIINVNNDYKVLKGNDYIIDNIGNKKYKISPSSFFQINSYQTKKLYDKVKEYLNLNKNDRVLDLYCGTGTIGIYVLDNAKEVLGIEINKDAIKDANINKELNKVENITFIAGDTKDVIKKLNFIPNKIIVDPPRAGLDGNVIKEIINMKPEIIVYVSCDPITLARDLNILKEKYEVKEITPVDMFSNTYHVECVCILKLR